MSFQISIPHQNLVVDSLAQFVYITHPVCIQCLNKCTPVIYIASLFMQHICSFQESHCQSCLYWFITITDLSFVCFVAFTHLPCFVNLCDNQCPDKAQFVLILNRYYSVAMFHPLVVNTTHTGKLQFVTVFYQPQLSLCFRHLNSCHQELKFTTVHDFIVRIDNSGETGKQNSDQQCSNCSHLSFDGCFKLFMLEGESNH